MVIFFCKKGQHFSTIWMLWWWLFCQNILLMEEILHHLGCIKPVVHSGIKYQPQLVNAGFLNHQQYDWFPNLASRRNMGQMSNSWKSLRHGKYRKCDGVYELEGIFGGILEDWCQSFDVFQLTLAFLMDFLLLTFS